ncbi:MAG: polysaccharide deacetylase family protein, partial [Clostridia bacterium]|nr:polysaccharide deacetylase family protein [Clostridia bacterium]
MTDIIFSFDTEDFTSSYAADAVYAEAEILRKEGVKGGFCLVGLFAKQLKSWGKTDIMEALQHHIIGNHSYGHTLHPTINEYTDLADFDEAQQECLRQETESESLIQAAVHNAPVMFACPPGNQKSYVAMYTYADMGYPIYADTVCDTPDGQGVFYCNIYHTQYTYMLESSFKALDSEESIRNILDKLATQKRAIIYTHPHYALVTECWDSVNYKKENLHPFGKWQECKRRDSEATERFYVGLTRLIQMIKQDKRFRITNYEALAETLAAEGERIVTKEDIPVLSAALNKEFFPVLEPCSLSISDMFLACRDLLLGEKEHKCGKVYGFLEQPFAITEETVLR